MLGDDVLILVEWAAVLWCDQGFYQQPTATTTFITNLSSMSEQEKLQERLMNIRRTFYSASTYE